MLSQISWHSLHMLPLVIALGVALVVAVVWLYPSQVRHVTWPWRWVLPGLRATGLLVLTASLLQPAALRLRRAEERAAVLVLVDRSRSMSVTDVGREPAQLVALADGLGRLPAGARPGETANLSSELDRLRVLVVDVISAGNDLETAQAFGRGIEAARGQLAASQARFAAAAGALAARAEAVPAEGELRLKLGALKDIPAGAGREAWAAEARACVAAAAAAAAAFQREADRKLYEGNAEVKAACDELAKLSRWALAEQALLRPVTGVMAKILETMPVVAYAVSDIVSPVALARGAEVKATLPTEPTARGSDIAGAVPAALASAGSRPLRAVVLFSDGRQVGGDPAVVSGLAPAGVPVFAVAVAPPGAAHDLGIGRDVSIPTRAFIGETVTIRASITAAGLPAGATDVQLRVGEVVQSQRVALIPGQPAPAEFSFRLEQGGPQKIVLSLPVTPGEITAENNQVERWVKVLPERMRVAAFAGTAGRDYQFLRNALARTRWVQLESGVLDPVQPALPLAPAQILQQDVLILSDVAVSSLSDVQWDAVNELVRARGGSLFMLAGPFNLPATYTPEAIVASGLLPYDAKNFSPAWREWPGGEAAFRLVPSPRAARGQLDALRLGDGPGDLRRWQSLPGAFRYLPIPELNSKLSTQALLVEADSRMPVLTESIPGAGRVFFLGADETWRWRLKAGEQDFDRFWLQLVRYAAGEPYAAERDLLALDVTPVAPAPGQPVAVRARILQGEPQAYRIEVLREGKAVQVQALAPAGPANSGRYAATVSGLPEGDYVVRLTDPLVPDPAAGIDAPLHVVASTEAEMADVSGDDGVLRRLAESSGGEFLTLDRLGELQSLLAATVDKRSRFSELPLWDSPFLFLFVVACFGAEWALRKRFGLA